jgi:hypothetical protein
MSAENEATNEPTNEPTSTEQVSVEKAADAVADLLPGIGAKLYLGCAILILILTVVGTPVTWMIQRDPKAAATTYVSLWRSTTNGQDGSSVFTVVDDLQCKDTKNRFKGAEAFAIISIGFSVVAVIVAFINVKLLNQMKVPVLIVNVLLLASTLITWGIGVSLYTMSFCDVPSPYDMKYRLYAGAGLFIAAFVLTIVGPVLMFVDPAPLEGDRLVRFTTILFSFTMLVTFTFAMAATVGSGRDSLNGRPVTWFERTYGIKGAGDYEKKSFSLWSVRSSITPGAASNTVMYKDLNGCDDFTKMWKATEAFAILTIVFSALSAAAGFFATAKSRAALILGIFVSAFSLITWALAAKIFYARWCNDLYYMQGNMYTMEAGFALFVVAWVVSTIGVIASAVANILA